jgi:hypothetical protein
MKRRWFALISFTGLLMCALNRRVHNTSQAGEEALS